MENSSKGFGLVGILTIIFIVLKLVDVIDWSWWWVLSPIWISISLQLLFFGFVLIMYVIQKRDK